MSQPQRCSSRMQMFRNWIRSCCHARTAIVPLGTSVLLLAVLVAAVLPLTDSTLAADRTPSRDAELFDLMHVWTVHLTFTAEQWEAMEPAGGPGPFGGPPGGPGPVGEPGPMPGPGGPPDPSAFGPGMFIAPVFMAQGDANQDQRLSEDELLALGRKWFDAWDVKHTDLLDMDSIREGLNVTMAPPPGADPPGMGPPGMGPPGAGPAPAPRMMFRGPDGKRNGIISVMGMEFPSVPADLDFDGQTLKNVSVRYKGNGTFLQSRSSIKRSLKIDLNDGYPGRKLLGVNKLNLHNNVTDDSWMNEVLSYRLFRDAGVPAPRTAYARVYVTVPGKYDREYLGLYSIIENIDNSFARDRFGTKKGAFFKPVAPDMFEDLGDDWDAYEQAYDPKTPVSGEETRRVIAFCKLVSHADDPQFAEQVEDFLDLDEFARFMAVTTWLSTCDSLLAMGQNYVVYLHPQTRKFQFIPWDLDHSFGQFYPIGTPEQRENLSIHKPWAGKNRFLERVFQVDKFKRRYLANLKELDATICRPERFAGQVDELARVLRPAVQEESSEKLARFDQVVAGEVVGPAGFGGGPPMGGPTMPGPPPAGPGFFGPTVKPIKAFVLVRAKSVGEQLAGRAEGATVAPLGLGGPGPPGPPGPGGPGAPGGFGPGTFLAPAFLAELDGSEDGTVTREELESCFRQWFDAWNTQQSDAVTVDQVRAGLNEVLSPFRHAPPGGFPFGPPEGDW